MFGFFSSISTSISSISSMVFGSGTTGNGSNNAGRQPQSQRLHQSRSFPAGNGSPQKLRRENNDYHRSATTGSLRSNQGQSVRRPQSSIVDFHGQTPSQAEQSLKKTLKENDKKGRNTTVITGQGNHSKNGRPVVKEAVIKTLCTERRSFTVKTNNPGAIVVKAKRG